MYSFKYGVNLDYDYDMMSSNYKLPSVLTHRIYSSTHININTPVLSYSLRYIVKYREVQHRPIMDG